MNKKVLLVILAMTIIASNAWAADQVWFGGQAPDTRDWFNANNWNTDPLPTGPVPGLADKAKINFVWSNPGPIISSAGAAVDQLYVAESAGDVPGAQTLTVTTGGDISITRETVLGYDGNSATAIYDDGKLLVTGGTVDCNHLFVGFNPNANGRLQIDSGTVDVNQMFGLSWNGGNGYAQLNGGVLHTEQFEFENVAGGTAAMDITDGNWIQEHYWWDKIKSLVWNGKITGYGQRANVVVTWDPVLERTTVTALDNDPNFPIVVKQGGGGHYTTIQAALNDAGLAEFDVIEVQDNATYTENLVFPDVNFLTLQAGEGFSPTITVSGTDVNTIYIGMNARGQTIQGFTIDFSGLPSNVTDSNSTMVFSKGGASTVRDCNIIGPGSRYIMGITAVAIIEDCEISECRVGIVCDLKETATGFRYSISGCHLHDNFLWGMDFNDCNAVVDDCLLEKSGKPATVGNTNILTSEPTPPPSTSVLNLLVKNSTIRDIIGTGRNLTLESKGTVTVEDCIIMGATYDEILQYQGTLNLNRCILKHNATMGACMNLCKEGIRGGGVTNIDHCSIEGSATSTQWAVYVNDPCGTISIRNSILTGPQGLFEAALGGEITTNWNNNYCDNPIEDEDDIPPGPNDINDIAYPYYIGVDPYYIQVNDVNLDTFFALQPYSPVVNADENGSYMGAKGPISGYEQWPADIDGTYGVDFNDFAVLALDWRDNNDIATDANVIPEDFESYSATGPGPGTLLDTWEVVGWYGDDGTSTLTLLTDPPNDVYDGNQAMNWVYDVNQTTGGGRYTEILVVLASDVNFGVYYDGTGATGNLPRSPYAKNDRIKVMLKRHTGNSTGVDTYLYAKFLNDIYGTYGKGGTDLTGPDSYDVAKEFIGGNTADPNDEWYRWNINLDSVEEPWSWGHANLGHVGAIIFGIRSTTETPGHGSGTIDVDDITLIDRPGCSGNPVGDLNYDCEVNFEDVKEFALYWLMGK